MPDVAMEGLLTPISTSYRTLDKSEEDALVEVPRSPEDISKPAWSATTPEQALELLRNEPDYDNLISILRYISNNSSDFNITSPGPLAAQLVYVLVSDIIPNYWNVLQESQVGRGARKGQQGRLRSKPNLDLLLSCLRSVTGLNAILLSIKQHIQKSRDTKMSVGGANSQDILTILLQALKALLDGDEIIETISNSIWHSFDTPSKQKAVWNEFLGLVTTGKILGITAEAEDVVSDLSNKVREKYWMADGLLYSSWLARNISQQARNLPGDAERGWNSCGELLNRSLRLGYSETVVKEIVSALCLGRKEYATEFLSLLNVLPSSEQRNVIYTVLKLLSKEHLSATVLSEDSARWWQADAGKISAAAGLISLTVANEEQRKGQLINWLTSSSGAGSGDGIAIRRAVIVSLARDNTDIETVLDKSLQQFGDQLYIKHTPTLQQEVHAQVLLLSAGYVHRKTPLRLSVIIRSGAHLSAVSNRLAASSPRARFLGMVVGESLSSLVDKGDKKMDFKVQDMNSSEAYWYKSLVTVCDTIGSIEPLKSGAVGRIAPKKTPSRSPKQVAKPMPQPSGSRIVAIEEIEHDEEDSDEDGLAPYRKPDSDAEDSDEDPTLITRNKPTAPVYIRDLITYLRDTDNYDRQKIALLTASPLIRRKVNFGTEVSSHAEELATLLVGLPDKYEIQNFQDMRLQGMIAVLVALPVKMGQWFSNTFFDGDYSISQRAAILTTLGVGARELGGFAAEDADLTSTKPLPSSSFPSKALPDSLHRLYASPSDTAAVDKLSTQLSNTMIAPMAADLADKLTGPSVLKVRTFSSRMEVEKKRKKPIANSLAKVVADGFFFPLTGRFFVHLKAYGNSRSNVVFQPYLLTLFIKTLSLLIHASGPSTLSLPQMTSEFWDLLLSLRSQSVGDITVMEALLFAFLTILEINEDKRRLVEAHGRQMLETQEWIEGVFSRVGAGGSEEDEKVRMLAAGCLVRIREVVEKYQALLLGDLASF